MTTIFRIFIVAFFLILGTSCSERESSLPEIVRSSGCERFPGFIRCNSEVISDGGLFVFDRGFLFTNLSGEQMKVSVGNGTGVFSAMILDEQREGYYYNGAYATNWLGTSYSKSMKVGMPLFE